MAEEDAKTEVLSGQSAAAAGRETGTEGALEKLDSDSILHGIDQYGSDEERNGAEDEEVDNGADDVEVEEESKIEIVEGGLNFVLKHFDGIGDFYGLIISYDQPYFRVVYEDSDCEELEVVEVEALLVTMASVPDVVISNLKGIAKSISLGRDVDEEGEVAELSEGGDEKLAGVDEWKYFVLKSFGTLGEFHGLIISDFPEEPFYKVVYEDGDCEDMDSAEVNACLVSADRVSAEIKQLLWAHAKSSTADASPSDFHQTTPHKASKKRSRGETTSPGAATAISGEKLVKNKSKQKKDLKHDEKEDDEGATVPKKLIAAQAGEWKYYVIKTFGDLGDFNGLVISYDKPFYKVVYEDNDSEDLTASEVKMCLVAANSVSANIKQLLWKNAEAITGHTPTPSGGNTASNKKQKKQQQKVIERKGSSKSKSGGRSSSSSSSSNSGKKKRKAETEAEAEEESEVNDASRVATNKNKKGKVRGLASSEGVLVLQEPVDSYDNYVLYSDGDSEELSREEALANLTSASDIPTKIKNQLRARARVYKQNPVPYHNEPLCESPSNEGEDASGGVNTYRDVPEDNIYQQYVGRKFVDTDENITFRVQSVCLHVDYDVLLFKYYDERQFLNQPELFNDPDKFEYSACSQMLQEDSWCKWAAEDQEQQKQELQEEGMGVAKVDVETTTVQQEQETSPVPEPVLKPEKEVTDKTETITKADADTTPGYQSESKQDSSQPVAVLERKLFVADVSPSHGESGLEGVVEEKH